MKPFVKLSLERTVVVCFWIDVNVMEIIKLLGQGLHSKSVIAFIIIFSQLRYCVLWNCFGQLQIALFYNFSS